MVANLPDPQPRLTPYLSVIPVRRPVQKTHHNIGHAKNAVNGKWGGYRGADCDMQIFEHTKEGWKLLYDIKKGDLEPPWRAGEIAEKERKKVAQLAREDSAARKEAKVEAEKTYNVIYDSAGYAVYKRSDYIEGYIEGYMKAREKFKPKGWNQ
jgi:hypothetical protein